MKPLALSTMYAQQDRFTDGAEFARYAAAAGYNAIEISHSTDEAKFDQVIESKALPITSVHQPAPRRVIADGRGNGKLNLASLDDDERERAIAHATVSIGWASRVGAKRSVIHLGHIEAGGEMLPEEFRMRRMFDDGKAGDPEFAELRSAAIAKRRETVGPHLRAARKSLRKLVKQAAPLGIAIGVENRYHYHEIPHPAEYDFILQGLDLDQAGYWHDTGHAEVLHRLGFIDRHAWFAANPDRVVGAHLHDVLGIGDHRAPGDGDVEWDYIVAGLKHLDRYTLEINQWQPDHRVSGAPAFLEGIGLR